MALGWVFSDRVGGLCICTCTYGSAFELPHNRGTLIMSSIHCMCGCSLSKLQVDCLHTLSLRLYVQQVSYRIFVGGGGNISGTRTLT